MKIKYEGLAHISIVVENVYQSVEFYAEHFGAIPLQEFPHFSQPAFTENLGWSSKDAENVDVTTIYTIIPDINLYFEIMQFHSPKPKEILRHDHSNDLGTINHISFKVSNLEEVFDYFKTVDGIEILNKNPAYKPVQLEKIAPTDFEFFDQALENNSAEKAGVCDIIGTIKFFIVKDFNGIHWEFEQGHSDVGG